MERGLWRKRIVKDVKWLLKNWGVFFLILLIAVIVGSFMRVRWSENQKEVSEVVWEPPVEIVSNDIAEPSAEEVETESEADLWFLLQAEHCLITDAEKEELNNKALTAAGYAKEAYRDIEIKDELYIIDQHAAHERVMYEKVKENYYSDDNKDSQMLLLPDVITLTHREMDILKDNLDMFAKAGFVLEEFGENTIKLTGVPNICLDLDTKELFLETLDEINQVARTAKQEIEERFIATVACKAAVKANMDLTPEEVDSLMNELLVLPNPFTCPHGRPTAIKMDKNDIEKKFARRK